MNVLVVVITYKRPDMLGRLLRSLAEVEYPHDVLVVDNDPLGSARSVVEGTTVRYVLESEPGIAAARNRGLKESVGYDALAFVDDDEYVVPGWLGHLVEMQQRAGAGVVCGPVIPELPSEAPRWIADGGFFTRPRHADGSRPKWPTTGNVLITQEALSRLEVPEFARAFSLTGGSDTEFFWRLERSGAKLVWSDSAIVHEEIPAQRANGKWLWRRNLRLGNVSARMLVLKGKSRFSIALVAVARILAAPLVGLYRVVRRRHWGPGLANLPKGIGMLAALSGNLTEEYQRPTATGQ